MMGHRDHLTKGSAFEALTHRIKRYFKWAAGERHVLKSQHSKRLRRKASAQLRRETNDERPQA